SLTICRSLEVFPELTWDVPMGEHRSFATLDYFAHADMHSPWSYRVWTGPADTDSAGLFIGDTLADAPIYKPMRSTTNDSPPPRARPVHSKRENPPLVSTRAAACEW